MLIASLFLILCSLASAEVGSVLVRYAVLDPDPSRMFMYSTAIPMLKSTICLAERHLAPALQDQLQAPHSYVIYTDNHTHVYVEDVIFGTFPHISSRVSLVNLDKDLHDARRLQPFLSLSLDPVNLASVRRTLADTVHLPSSSRRLLLGLDISFLRRPAHFVEAIIALKGKQAVYMSDSFWAKISDTRDAYVPYVLRDYYGPQCPGLLGDFIYLNVGVEISTELLQQKVEWYARQERVPWRTYPSARHLRGLHGVDQFALSLALGEVVEPKGEDGCFILDREKYYHRGDIVRPPLPIVEAIHDKVISSCEAQCYDTCGSIPAMSGSRGYFWPDVQAPSCPRYEYTTSSVANPCYDPDSWFSSPLLYHLRPLRMLVMTLCRVETFLSTYLSVVPRYVLFVNHRLCGQIGMLLHHDFPDWLDRVRLVNLEIDPAVLLTYGERVASCVDYQHVGDATIMLEVHFQNRDAEEVAYMNDFALMMNESHVLGQTLMLLDTVFLEAREDHYHLQFCLCGDIMKTLCPRGTDKLNFRRVTYSR